MSYQNDPTLPYRWNDAVFDDRRLEIHGESLFYVAVLFSVVLLVALLFLYARWICSFGPPAGPAASRTTAPAPGGLDPATINNFPVVMHKSSPTGGGGAEAVCCICLGIFSDGDELKMLPQCRHRFHPECVGKWLTTQSSCPLCRASLRVNSVV